MSDFRLHFDTRSMNDHFQGLWARRLADFGRPDGLSVVADPAEADVIIDLSARHQLGGGQAFSVHPDSYYHRWPERTFDWDSTDFPSGRMAGLYCSLSTSQFDPARHRGFCYPWRHNAAVGLRAQTEAKHLYGFSGSITSALRARLLAVLSRLPDDGRQLIRQTGGMWERMFRDGPDPDKTRYADDLAHCKFILCPRGNGLASIRLYETMESGRVPVILSDGLALPQCIDWSACSVRVAERDLAHIPRILAGREADWPALARSARAQWENKFSDARLLTTMAEECRVLLASRRPSAWSISARILPSWLLFQAKAARRKLQKAVRRTP